MKPFSTFRYLGSKKKFVPIIYRLINPLLTNESELIEPFCGSAVVSVNLSPLFNKVIISDIDENVLNIHNLFKHTKYSDYQLFMKKYHKYVHSRGILLNKELYYEFRNIINAEDNEIFKQFGIYMCMSVCLNGMVRFGPNGFNQSVGNIDLAKRFNILSYNRYQSYYNNIEIINSGYEDILNTKVNNNSILFLDPPYFGTGCVYNSNFEHKSDKVKFLDIIKQYENTNHIIYTDVYDEDTFKYLNNNSNLFKVLRLRDMRKISPHIDADINDNVEVIYTNINRCKRYPHQQ